MPYKFEKNKLIATDTGKEYKTSTPHKLAKEHEEFAHMDKDKEMENKDTEKKEPKMEKDNNEKPDKMMESEEKKDKVEKTDPEPKKTDPHESAKKDTDWEGKYNETKIKLDGMENKERNRKVLSDNGIDNNNHEALLGMLKPEGNLTKQIIALKKIFSSKNIENQGEERLKGFNFNDLSKNISKINENPKKKEMTSDDRAYKYARDSGFK